MNSMIFGITIFLTFIYTGNAILCYECNSGEKYNGTVCSDPAEGKLTPNMAINCTAAYGSNYVLCRKMTQNVGGDYRVIRSCATSGRVNQCYGRTGTSNIKLEYCECDSNHCNAASSLFNALAVVLSIVSALFVTTFAC